MLMLEIVAASFIAETYASFQGIRTHLEKNQDAWKEVFDNAEPQTATFPAPWPEKLSEFHNMLVLRCIRPDKVVAALQNFVQRMNTLLSEL
jgi:dynein heavy chain